MRMNPAKLYLLFVAPIFLSCAATQIHRTETLPTRFGDMAVEKRSTGGTPDTLVLNNSEILREAGQFLHLYRKFELKNKDVVLIGINCGGSGCPLDNLRLVVLSAGASPKIVGQGSAKFTGNESTLKLKQKGQTVILDLGYEDKKHKIASFYGPTEKLEIKEEKISRTASSALPNTDCRWLFDSVLRQCVESAPDCADVVAASTEAPAGVMRTYNLLIEDPRFKQKAFESLCVQSCQSKKSPTFSHFQKKVCGLPT